MKVTVGARGIGRQSRTASYACRNGLKRMMLICVCA